MGSWAAEAFANDAALDAAPGLVSEEAVIEALDNFLVAEIQGQPLSDLSEPAYAAAEIVCAVRDRDGGEIYWQSEHTTLGSGGEGKPYIPKEVAAFILSESAFSDRVAEAALRVVDSLAANPEREGWFQLDERRAALATTRERLLNPARGWSEIELGPRQRLSELAAVDRSEPPTFDL